MRRIILAVAAVLLAGVGAAAAQGLTLESRLSVAHGRYLTDRDGRTLYSFSADRRGQGAAAAESRCTGTCTNAYRPVLVEAPPQVRGPVQQDLIATIERPDGGTQLTYDGWPLYRYVGDQGAGAASAAGMSVMGGTWALVSPAAGDTAPPPQAGLFSGLDLRSPECVRHDSARDRYYVSNVNGGMRDADDNGFISLVTADGFAQRKWIDGGKEAVSLNAPKGMQIADGYLYVADIDHLRVFELETGAPAGAIYIEGAEFLNGLVLADDGGLYVTDTGTDPASGAIYHIGPDRTVTKIVGGAPLKRPNGIDFGPDGNLVVVTYAADEVMLITREGQILGRKTLDQGQLDGLVVLEDGTVFVSSWVGNHIVRITSDGQAETVVTGLVQPACFEYLPEKDVLLVPQVKLNSVAVVGLSPEERG